MIINDSMLGKVLQCHVDKDDPETFVIGKLLAFDNLWFLLQDVLPSGHWNGFALYLVADLVRIHETSRYLERINILLTQRSQKRVFEPPIKSNLLVGMLNYAKTNGRIIGFELQFSGYRDINGIILDFSEGKICVQAVNEYGEKEDDVCLELDAITRCFVEDDESECLEILRNARK